jgi:beta-glucosidase
MRPKPRRIVAALTAALLTLVVTGAVVAATRSSDEQALQPVRHKADRGIERKVDALLRKMTVQEKLQQVQLLSDGQITDADAKAGVGGVFSLVDPDKINHFQHVAVEQSRLHIPILFAYDTIHGYRTIFPVPLGAASSFDPNLAQTDAAIGARESATVGIKQVYSPMVDVSHEPRWGRIAEGNGEDPYLGSVMAAARVKGDQGTDYSAPDKVVASVKHFAAYGQPEGGRDYNTTDMSISRLFNLYLPPFKAAIDAGADTAMCSFNAINGVPGCANYDLETRLLKQRWGFDGFIESDYTAVAETRACPPKTPDEGPCGHGTAADGPDAGAKALMALRPPVRRRQQGQGPGLLPDQGRPGRRAQRGQPLDGPAQERRRPAAAGPVEEDGRHRAAGQGRPRHARPVVGPGQGRGRRDRPGRRGRPDLLGPVLRRGLHARGQGSAGQHAGR